MRIELDTSDIPTVEEAAKKIISTSIKNNSRCVVHTIFNGIDMLVFPLITTGVLIQAYKTCKSQNKHKLVLLYDWVLNDPVILLTGD